MNRVMMDNPIFFVIQPQSIVDVITNSSSELFVFSGNEKSIVETMIKDIYPDYLSEYEELKSIHELDLDEIETYLDYKLHSWNDSNDLWLSELTNIAPELLYSNYAEYLIDKKWSWLRLNAEALPLLQEFLTKQGNSYFLFSKGENPNWEMQELLENIGYRYHLG